MYEKTNIAPNIRNAYRKYVLLSALNICSLVMTTTIKFPKAFKQNQAASMTDFIHGGDWVNENASPGIESHTSPIIIKKNCGNCQRMEIFWCESLSIASCNIPAQTKDTAALMPPISMLFRGEIRTLHSDNAGVMTFSQSGINAMSKSAPTAFACNQNYSQLSNILGRFRKKIWCTKYLICFEFKAKYSRVEFGRLKRPSWIDLCE